MIEKFIDKMFKLKKKIYLNYLSDNKPDKLPTIIQPAIFKGKGKIQIDESVWLGYNHSPRLYDSHFYVEARDENALISIDKNTMISNSCIFLAFKAAIKIGKNCRIGSNVQFINSDFHSTNPKNRDNPDFVKSKDIAIGDNVFIGNNVIILKGTCIGNNCTVGAGSVVGENKFPDNVIIAGNPAKIVRKVENES